MPIYSYECKDCGKKFDLLIGVGVEKDELKCIKCKGKNIQKIFASFSIGSGKSSSGSTCPTGTCSLPR